VRKPFVYLQLRKSRKKPEDFINRLKNNGTCMSHVLYHSATFMFPAECDRGLYISVIINGDYFLKQQQKPTDVCSGDVLCCF
jgi:hypothetical protein